MTTAKDCKSSADFLNLLQEKIAPWFFYELMAVTETAVLLKIGANKVIVFAASHSSWCLAEPRRDGVTQIDLNLIRHINGVLAGAVRDDSGKLQPPKEPESAVS